MGGGGYPGRNLALFDTVRWWAYAQNRGAELERWIGRVRTYTLHNNQRFPEPLLEDEAVSLGYGVSTWTWSGGGPVDHSPETQRRRGLKSGKVRRAAVAQRDRAIIAARAAGMSLRAIASKHGLKLRGGGGGGAARSTARRSAAGGRGCIVNLSSSGAGCCSALRALSSPVPGAVCKRSPTA